MSGSIKDLVRKYQDEWLLIRVRGIDEVDRPTTGELVFHSKNRDEVYEKQRKMKGDLYITYSGKIPRKGYAVAFHGQNQI
jgi:hypothetical protein